LETESLQNFKFCHVPSGIQNSAQQGKINSEMAKGEMAKSVSSFYLTWLARVSDACQRGANGELRKY
jgi:hypothetical protein